MNKHITDDSREIQDGSLFLSTPQNQKFIDSLPKNTHVIQRDDLKKYYKTNIHLIGITGTNGKTTTAAAMYSILLDMGYKVALLGTRGMFINEKQIKPKGLTTPKLLELYQDIDMAVAMGCEYFVMEVSSHAIKQERIYGLDFSAKILTNMTSDHLDYHKTLEDYYQTKLSFLQSGDCIKVINLDDKNGAKLRFLPRVFSYGIESKGDFFVNAYSLNDGIFAQMSLRMRNILERIIRYNNEDSKLSQEVQEYEKCELHSVLFGYFNLSNLMAAILALKLLTQRELQEICDLANNFAGVAGRMEVISLKPLIIVDFAHTTDGMEQIFHTFKTKNISVVFGAGGDRDKTKRPKMGACAAHYANKIYITNDNPRGENPQTIADEILEGVKETLNLMQTSKDSDTQVYTSTQDSRNNKSVTIILDRAKAIQTALEELPKDWVLLVLGKGDESVQIFKDKEIHFSDKECIIKLLETNNHK